MFYAKKYVFLKYSEG